MIEILKNLFRKKEEPIEVIKSHKRIFEDHLRHIMSEDIKSSKKEKKIHLRVASQEDYLNRVLNSNYHTNIFNYHLITNIDLLNNKVTIEIKPGNLKSELVLIGYKYKNIKNISKNFKHLTYIIKDKSIKIGKTKVYTPYAIIGNDEIYILKGHEDGI